MCATALSPEFVDTPDRPRVPPKRSFTPTIMDARAPPARAAAAAARTRHDDDDDDDDE